MLDEKSINTVRKIFSRHDRGYYHWTEYRAERLYAGDWNPSPSPSAATSGLP